MIQTVSSSDFPKILSWVEALQSPQFNWSADALRAELMSGHVVGFYDGEAIVAFACLRQAEDHDELTVLATHPNHQGKGLMTQLLVNTLGQIGGRKPLWLEVHEANQSARYLYEKLGFRQTGKRAKYYSDGATAILYTWESRL